MYSTGGTSAPNSSRISRLSDSVLYLTRGVVAPPELTGHTELLQVYVPDAISTGPAPVVGGRVFRLPSNPETMERFNRRGHPFVLAEPRGFLSRAIGRIARYLTRQQVGLVLAGGAAWGPSATKKRSLPWTSQMPSRPIFLTL